MPLQMTESDSSMTNRGSSEFHGDDLLEAAWISDKEATSSHLDAGQWRFNDHSSASSPFDRMPSRHEPDSNEDSRLELHGTQFPDGHHIRAPEPVADRRRVYDVGTCFGVAERKRVGGCLRAIDDSVEQFLYEDRSRGAVTIIRYEPILKSLGLFGLSSGSRLGTWFPRGRRNFFHSRIWSGVGLVPRAQLRNDGADDDHMAPKDPGGVEPMVDVNNIEGVACDGMHSRQDFINTASGENYGYVAGNASDGCVIGVPAPGFGWETPMTVMGQDVTVFHHGRNSGSVKDEKALLREFSALFQCARSAVGRKFKVLLLKAHAVRKFGARRFSWCLFQ